MKQFFLAICILPITLFAQVGINTNEPTKELDINGDLRVRKVLDSESSQDIALVVDKDGVVKKSITDASQFKAYLASDFTSGSDNIIYKITNMNIIEDYSNDFDLQKSVFVPSYDGIYNIVITITSTLSDNLVHNNSVVGLVDDTTNRWIMRFSIPKDYISSLPLNSMAGVTNTFVGTASLKKGQSYYFGVSSNMKLLYKPTGDTGEGIGTYFSIELLKLG